MATILGILVGFFLALLITRYLQEESVDQPDYYVKGYLRGYRNGYDNSREEER